MKENADRVELREFVESLIAGHDRFHAAQLEALRCKMLSELEQRDKALQLQAAQNQTHFESLNHEAARILEASQRTVSADTWQAFKESDSTWKAHVDRRLQESVTRTDFESYIKSTDNAFSLREGEMRGRQKLFSWVAAVASILAVIAGLSAIWTFVWSLG